MKDKTLMIVLFVIGKVNNLLNLMVEGLMYRGIDTEFLISRRTAQSSKRIWRTGDRDSLPVASINFIIE